MKQLGGLAEGRQTKNCIAIVIIIYNRLCLLWRPVMSVVQVVLCDVTDGLSYSRITLLVNAAQD